MKQHGHPQRDGWNHYFPSYSGYSYSQRNS